MHVRLPTSSEAVEVKAKRFLRREESSVVEECNIVVAVHLEVPSHVGVIGIQSPTQTGIPQHKRF